MWGGVLNVARNIVRGASSSWGFPVEERALLEMLGRWVIAMPYLLKAHIAKASPRQELESLLPVNELEFLLSSKEPCQRCAQVFHASLLHSPLSEVITPVHTCCIWDLP